MNSNTPFPRSRSNSAALDFLVVNTLTNTVVGAFITPTDALHFIGRCKNAHQNYTIENADGSPVSLTLSQKLSDLQEAQAQVNAALQTCTNCHGSGKTRIPYARGTSPEDYEPCVRCSTSGVHP